MLDLDCACGLCGHEQFQRFYHSTPFHELTVVALEQIADNAALKAGYECENCGEPVGANQVRRSCVTFGFADDAGVIRIFDELRDGTRRVELTENRRLDPQAVPRWQADPQRFEQGHRVVGELTEQVVEEVLGRPMNVKLAWRDLLVDRSQGCHQICEGLTAVIAGDEEEAGEQVRQLREENVDNELTAIRLDDSKPDDRPVSASSTIGAGYKRWLPDEIVDAIESEELIVVGVVSRQQAVQHLTRTFDAARLDYDRTDGETVTFDNFTTPTDTTWDDPLAVSTVLRRAIYCGLTPGEAARLTAEEIVGTLLQVW